MHRRTGNSIKERLLPPVSRLASRDLSWSCQALLACYCLQISHLSRAWAWLMADGAEQAAAELGNQIPVQRSWSRQTGTKRHVLQTTPVTCFTCAHTLSHTARVWKCGDVFHISHLVTFDIKYTWTICTAAVTMHGQTT